MPFMRLSTRVPPPDGGCVCVCVFHACSILIKHLCASIVNAAGWEHEILTNYNVILIIYAYAW